MSNKVQRLRGRKAVARRRRWLSEHPLCVACFRKTPQTIRAATIVDHVVALVNGGVDDESNFQSLCFDCSEDKTRIDLGQRAVVEVNEDGEPRSKDDPWYK